MERASWDVPMKEYLVCHIKLREEPEAKELQRQFQQMQLEKVGNTEETGRVEIEKE